MVVVTSGGFDPIHPGHIEYLQRAKACVPDGVHICIVNSDVFLDRKKGYHVQDCVARMTIVNELKCVDQVMPAIDTDNTVCETLRLIQALHPRENIIFAKGGDRKAEEIPEYSTCKELGIRVLDGLGEKLTSSQAIIQEVLDGQCKSS